MKKKQERKSYKIIILILLVLIIFLLLKFCAKKTYTLTINLNYETKNQIIKIELKEKEKYELETPNRDGYVFNGWTIEGENSKVEKNIFIMGTEDTELKANWEKETYKINYELNGGNNGNDIVTDYTEDTDTFILPTPNKDGYTFNGWYTNSDFTGDVETKVEKGNKENKNYYAKWEPTIYKVTYNLEGGKTSQNLVKEYTIESESFDLVTPTKKDYIFVGWIGSDITSATTNVTIDKGSIGDKTYTAKWKPIEYSIKYELNGGTLPTNAVNTFTANTKTFNLPTPTKKGYTFLGWYTNNKLTGNEIKQIKKGTRKDQEYYAKWELTTYKIKYEFNGGIIENNLVVNYTMNTDTFTLINPVKEHYVFTGWTGSNGKKLNTKVSIVKGSTGNKEFIANYKPLDYKINYELNGGTLDKPVNTYNIETNTFNLQTPTRKGYKFLGWCSDEELTSEYVTKILKGTTGEKTYYAKWETITYEINYELNGGTNESDPTTSYTIETDTFNLALPTKKGYNFKGWYLDENLSNKAKNILEKGTTGNKTYYAKWEKYKTYDGSNVYEMIESEYASDDVESLFVSSPNGIDFTKASSISNGQGIYIMASTKNDLHPIYYYRGAVETNNIILGNYCWKIMRTTNTGGIKLLYNGLSVNGNCNNTGADTQIAAGKSYAPSNIGIAGAGYSYTEKTRLKLSSKKDKTILQGTIFAHDVTYDEETGLYHLTGDKVVTTENYATEKLEQLKDHHYTCFTTTDDGCTNVYYAYMDRDLSTFYATLKGGQKIEDLLKIEFEGNSTNSINSTVQTVVNNWYRDNMTAYTTYLEDTVFCNDRSIYNPWSLNSSIENNNDLKMHFATKARVAYTGRPITTCKYKADSFTVDSKNGNGVLTYPIGLITYDEASLAGMSWNEGSDNSYIYNGKVWWTMSPGFVSATGIYNGVIHSSLDHVAVNYVGSKGSAGGVRPVISLNSNAKIKTGDGSVENPFIIDESPVVDAKLPSFNFFQTKLIEAFLSNN